MHGTDSSGYAYGMWPMVVFNILLFLFFTVSFIRPRKRFEWQSMGVFTGFLVALFVEMYGFPLTIYVLTTWLGKSYPALNPFYHSHGNLWLVLFGLADGGLAMTILHLIGTSIIFTGFYIMYKGWMLIHDARGERLVTEGIYAYARHPQYTGIFLITVGFLIQWPSIPTLAMWPILIFAYYKLAKREETEIEQEFGHKFLDYKKRVPAFIPRLGKGA